MIKISEINISAADTDRLLQVISTGNLVHGTQCSIFEDKLSEYLSIPYVTLVSSGTAALYLSLLSLGINFNHAVLVPDFTFPATVNVVKLLGATPIMVDVDPYSYTITFNSVKDAISRYKGPKEIKAIMPVHEFGCPIELNDIINLAKEMGIYIIEDAACALGSNSEDSRIGSQGDIACFSFHPRKILTTGEGGAIATFNQHIASSISRLKNHGISRIGSKVDFLEAGHNFRMTDIQAALGIGQLDKLDEWISTRRHLANIYQDLLFELKEKNHIKMPKYDIGHNWQTYMIVLSDMFNRDRVIHELREHGIETSVGAQCISNINHMLHNDYTLDNESISSKLGKQGLALPMCERYTHDILETVVKKLTLVLESQTSN